MRFLSFREFSEVSFSGVLLLACFVYDFSLVVIMLLDVSAFSGAFECESFTSFGSFTVIVLV